MLICEPNLSLRGIRSPAWFAQLLEDSYGDELQLWSSESLQWVATSKAQHVLCDIGPPTRSV